jgi:hypothetical protein
MVDRKQVSQDLAESLTKRWRESAIAPFVVWGAVIVFVVAGILVSLLAR